MPKVQGITKASLWTAWKNVRKQLSRTFLRDVTDFVEFDIDPDWWIKRLLKDVEAGSYEPDTPHRFSVAKKIGFSRRMTLPGIPDLVLYRAIVDHMYQKARRFERKHVYFAQNTLSKKVQQVEQELVDGDPSYTFASGSAMAGWLKYDQYRKQLLLEHIHPYIVITDITNFFDSVLYDRVADALHGIRLDRNLVGLLFFILERLSIRDAFNESPRIGLPVDDFDCSRTLAHMVLFPHDDRMAGFVGDGAYIRWMDDQNFGAESYAEGLNILKKCGDSLARLHLTPNASKSRILSLAEASRHFHFDINADLDVVGAMPRNTAVEHRDFRSALGQLWRKSRKFEKCGGEWGKILKRVYRLAGIAGARFLRHRAMRDILSEPTLTDRVADYMRVTGCAGQYVDFVLRLWKHEEQVYPDVNQVLAEGLLCVEPTLAEATVIRKIASRLLSQKYDMPGWQRCAALAPLLILRFGDKRSLRLMKRLVSNLDNVPHPAIAKAVVAVYVSYGLAEYQEAVSAASRLRDNYLAHFLRMVDLSLQYDPVPDRFKIRREPVYDTVAGLKRVDMRKLLVLRLLRLNNKKTVRKWIMDTRDWMVKQDVSDFDKGLV
ncbi:MAG: RNA-directed DNA polymerase, partial [Candidatus Nitrotoga sp.]